MSGMHTSTAYRHEQRLLSLVRDCFSQARHFKLSHEELRTLLDRVYQDSAYKRLPAERRGYLRGWIASEYQRMYDVLEWRVYWRGELHQSKDVYDGTWSECDPNKGRHVYRADPTKLY